MPGLQRLFPLTANSPFSPALPLSGRWKGCQACDTSAGLGAEAELAVGVAAGQSAQEFGAAADVEVCGLGRGRSL